MAELLSSENLQPYLLDRLTDLKPAEKMESRLDRVISHKQYKEGVFRDLSWLLNAKARVPADGLEDFPEAEESVLNYGMRDLCGMLSSEMNMVEMERHLVRVIQEFEPRILKNTLKVKLTRTEDPKEGSHQIALRIEGDLWALPVPERLLIQTALDLETGRCKLVG